MRISDWSSDVCSSDLRNSDHSFLSPPTMAPPPGQASRRSGQPRRRGEAHSGTARPADRPRRDQAPGPRPAAFHPDAPAGAEIGEHTSELQSLMRISYAVFCLKKKKNKRHEIT